MKRSNHPPTKESPSPPIASLLDSDQTAGILNISPLTLGKWRSIGVGPRFIKVGRMPRYRLSDIQNWLERRASTGEAA